MPRYAGVVIEAPLTTVFHYRVPDILTDAVRPGVRVTVPLGRGNRKTFGFCVEVADECPIDPKRVKDVLRAGAEEERVPEDLLNLTKWVAGYYRTGWGTVLAAAVPSAVRRERNARTEAWVSLSLSREDATEAFVALERRAKKQAAVLRLLIDRLPEDADEECPDWVEASALESESGASRPVLRAMQKKGLLHIEDRPVLSTAAGLSEAEKTIALTPEQGRALTRLVAAIDARTFAPFLLYGVTGSGKTEVYLRALDRALALGRGVLVLVPEISLTPQTVERFRRHAGEVAVLHSRMADGERAETWRRIRDGELRVVVGARSAVFAPVRDLGLIIVDEEHERTFKQENDPRYHARDVAVVRAKECDAAVVLGSATPSLESWKNAAAKKYEVLSLPYRVGGAKRPETEVVDLRREWAEVKRPVLISRELEKELRLTLARNEQAILFLNRRGFNTFVQCRSCGEPVRCKDCDIALSHHRRENVLKCHHCGYTVSTPRACTLCSAEALHFSGTGTERADDVLSAVVPEARVLRMDSDTMTGRDSHADALAAFSRQEYDILVGTQMVAKGFDFPNVTLVGVLAADSALNLPDFRAAERTFQLVTQVVGRAGRADKPGRAVIQAFQPDHHALLSAMKQDFPAFAERELADRRGAGYPPFGRIARVVIRGKSLPAVKQAAADCAEALRQASPRPLMVLGPSECPIARLQGEHRWHMLIKAKEHAEVLAMLRAASDCLSLGRGGIRSAVDIDAQSML